MGAAGKSSRERPAYGGLRIVMIGREADSVLGRRSSGAGAYASAVADGDDEEARVHVICSDL